MSQILHGDALGNSLTVTADSTQVYGLAGNDTLTSVNRDDVLLIGGSGNDVLQFSGGNGTLSGGTGADTFEFYYSAAHPVTAVIEDIDPANDKIIVNGTTTPQLTSTADEKNLIVTSEDGYLNVILVGSQEAKNYFDGTAPEEVWDVLRFTNNERADQNSSWLTLNQDLTDGAAIRAVETSQTFDHTRPNGSDYSTVLNVNYQATGENIAAGQTSAENVVNAWMNSTGHRDNLLSGSFDKLGVGYYNNAATTYQKYWVQMFGGTSTTATSLTQNDLSKVSVTAGTGTLSADSTEDLADPNDTSTWVSDWIFSDKTYTGGLQTIWNYLTGEKIYFGTDWTSAFFDDLGNFLIGSDLGVLTVQNAFDKIIDVSNFAGQTLLLAYKAFLPSVLDGRGLSSFEIIVGSNFGADVIFAGDKGSQLWGGADLSADILVGGDGADIFIGGRFQGTDTFLNASGADAVNFSDASLSDIVATAEIDGTIAISFNTGNVVTLQSSDTFSAAISLSDGSTWRFNHSTKTWQTA